MSDAEKKTDFTRPLAHLEGARPPAPAWFEDAVAAPSEEGAVTVRGATVRYSAWGERGQPGLLFIHGGRAHRNWWRPFAPFFSDTRRVAALDLSGMGDSDWRNDYSIDILVDEVFAVIGEAGLAEHTRPILVGHSFGGWVTLAAVERAGDELGGAVVVDAPLGVPDPTEGYAINKPRNGDDPNAPPQRDRMRIYETPEEPISRFRLLPDQPGGALYLLDYIAREGIKPVDGPEGRGWTWKFDPHKVGNFEIHFERDLLRASRCPLAFIYGERSAFATGEVIGHLREQARGRSPFILVPEAYHHLMMDQPIAFIGALRMLLACWPVRVGH